MDLNSPGLGTIMVCALFSILFTAFIFKAVCFDPLIKEVKALRSQLSEYVDPNVREGQS